jgi:hypothetical protein
MLRVPKRPLRAYWLFAAALWALLVAAFAAWVFLARPPDFSPEMGPVAGFFIAGTLYSGLYWLVAFLLSPVWHGLTSYVWHDRA